jgi:hypothetical protein
VTVVILVGEIVPLLLVGVIVLVARRYSVSDSPEDLRLAGASDADVAQVVAAGRTIDAIEMYRKAPRKRPETREGCC